MRSFSAAAFLFAFTLAALPAQEFTPVRIPLYIFNTGNETAKQYKAGIRLQIGSVADGGSTPWRMYEFDTGGTGFFAFPFSASQNATGTYTANYASGNVLSGNRSTTAITFESVALTPGPSVTSDIVLVTGAASPNSENSLNSWTTLLPSTAPLETYFFGDFGMSLGSLAPTGGAGPNLYAVIPQLLGAQNRGFIINLGTRPSDDAVPDSDGVISRGWIQVGLTPEQQQKAAWASTVAMVPPSGETYPNSGAPVYSEILSEGTFELTGIDQPLSSGIVYDTGAPNVEIHPVGADAGLSPAISGNLVWGSHLKLTGQPANPPNDSKILDFTLANASGRDEAKLSQANVINSPGLYVNTGITAFFGNEVIFDLENGFVGFNPIPEPSVAALLAAGLGFLVLRRRATPVRERVLRSARLLRSRRKG